MHVRFRTGFVLLVSFAFSQAAGPATDEQLVDLNVVAVDSHGQPVTDLTRDDFQVTDNRKPQTIAFFRHNDNKLWQVPRLGPNEFSNRTRANVPCATLVLFDLLNERFGTRGAAASQLVRHLEGLESADYLYLYLLTLDGRLYAVHGISRERGAAEGEAPWTRQIKQLLDGALRSVTQMRRVDIDVAVRVELTYRALEGIAVELSRIPGRKNIVWITDGIPIGLGPRRSDTGDFVDFTPQLRELSSALDRSGIAIYPVRQVMLGSPDSMGAGPDMIARPGAPQEPGITGIGSVDTLDEFAGMTGGRPDAGKDLGAAIRQAMNDVRSSYQIGYYPSFRNWDGKLHKLRVTCKRKGVKIQAKTGYYAWEEAPAATATRAIDGAAMIPFDAAEIGLRGTMIRDSLQADAARVEARIDGHDIALAREGNQYTGNLWLALASYTSEGRPQISPLAPAEIRYDQQQRDRALKEGIRFTRTVTIPENVRQLRLIVFDRGANTIGSVSIPVKQ